MRQAAAAVLLFAFSVGTTCAAELRSIQVDHDKGRYTVASEVWFDASVEQVFEVFRQWDLSTQFSSAIAESRDLAADEQGRPGYFVRNEGCLLFFCKSFVRQGYVELKVNEELRAIADPASSDFKLSRESWTFVEENGGTVVSYKLLMEPDFWIPPGIGPYLIKRKFRNNGGDAIDRIEQIARGIGADPDLIID
ncbi:MAG: SRPBCC family protein [Woeseiaceae bacterium]